MASDEGFFSRWARRKSEAAKGEVAGEAAAPHPLPLSPQGRGEEPTPSPRCGEGRGEGQPQPQVIPTSAAQPPPLPTLADVATLTRDSDYSRFVAAGVDEGVKRAALKKLFFSDPHFNVMDGLDTYIEDYNKPDPLPAAMLRKMWQSKSLGLFDDDDEEQQTAQASPDGASEPSVSQSAPDQAVPLPDENPDLRLQPDDEAGRPGPDAGTRPREV